MNLTTSYLGFKLKNPIVVGSSTFTGTVDGIVKCAKAGAGAVVLKSLFEEQILSDIKKEEGYTDIYTHNVCNLSSCSISGQPHGHHLREDK